MACKALGQDGVLPLAEVDRTTRAFVRPQGDRLYVFAYQHALARSELFRVGRDGNHRELLGRYPGLGPPTSFTVFGSAAYFWRKQSIYRVDLATSQEAGVVAQDVARPFVADDQGLMALRCGAGEVPDELIRINTLGAESTIAVMPARPAGSSCRYQHVSHDATSAFVSDWTSRRIYRVTLATGAVDVLVEDHDYPLRTFPERDRLVFHSGGGLFAVPKAGGAPTQLSPIGVVPHSTVVPDGGDYWIHTAVRFTTFHGLYRIPGGGGTAQLVPTFRPFSPKDPLYQDGFMDLALDDQCLYFARRGHAHTPTTRVTILAQRKPPAAPAPETVPSARGK